MEITLVFVRFFCFLLFIFEVLFSSTADSLGVADVKFPSKFNYINNYKLRPERKPTGRSSRSQDASPRFGPSIEIKDEYIEQSKILEFINTIRTNATVRNSYCNKSTEKTITLDEFNYKFGPSSFQRFKKQEKNAKFLAKCLTNLYNNNKNIRLKSFADEHVSAIIAVLRIIIEEDHNLAGGGIAFKTQFFPYIHKVGSDVTKDAKDLRDDFNFTAAQFYTTHSQKKFDPSSDVTSNTGDIASTSEDRMSLDDAFWGQPYFDCHFLKRWIVALSIPFYEYNHKGTAPIFKGVVVLDIDLNKTAINQCDNSDTIFSGSHKCRPETTKCQYTSGQGFGPGSYECHCKSGSYFPVLNATQAFFSGTEVERHFLQSIQDGSNFSTSDFQCLPCRQECIDCADDSPCFVEYNILMRGIPLGIQSFCMTITLVLGIVVLRFRKSKVMVSGMWCLLEIILLGALFLYATVVIQYFEPSTTTCLIVPWLREVGFAILYGALVLKIYRLLADFQSRKAHRVHVRDKDLLKYLLCIVIVVTGYMAAWTAVNIDQIQEDKTLIERGVTSEGDLHYFVCKSGRWDYATEIAEVLFLIFGIYLCYRVRAAPSEYSEGTYVSAAICYEWFISTVFYVVRHIYWLDLHPDYLFLMYFLRCQLTVTATLILVFAPKLWYAHRPPDERQLRNRAYSSSDVPDNMAPETMKLNVGISSNGDVDVGEVSLADMDPEDIRAELKRLYTQLQIYKTRSMRKDNPHISKRRGGRKQTHRRFSLQAFHHKHRHHHDHDHEHEMSKTPEESTNSAEGLSMPLEMSVSKCEELNENKPSTTVSFKMCHTHK